MQIVIGLLRLKGNQPGSSDDLKQLVLQTTARISAISLVHDLLYVSHDLSRISLQKYIRDLCLITLQNFNRIESIRIEYDIDPAELLIDTAVPFGLILNELLMNSIQHGYNEKEPGVISIALKIKDETTMVLSYKDNGRGTIHDFDFKSQTSLGLQMIFSLGSVQLGGVVEMKNDHGVVCNIEFKNNLYKVRV
jgi:two-component sensor histidine kinase